jgi:hypothetical protein
LITPHSNGFAGRSDVVLYPLDSFESVWVVAYSVAPPPGERPKPLAMAARELRSGRTVRLNQEELALSRIPPFPIGGESLFVTFGAAHPLQCQLAMGWPIPRAILDLQTEFRCQTSGLDPEYGSSILGALAWYGLDLLLGAPCSVPTPHNIRHDSLDACDRQLQALVELFRAIVPVTDFPRALLRGRYMAAVARMEWTGIPIDVPTYVGLRDNWSAIKTRLRTEISSQIDVFENREISPPQLLKWAASKGLVWPLAESGWPNLDEDTLRDMAHRHPDVALLREFLVSFRRPILNDLAVGSDGRNRTSLNAFGTITGRNAPSSNASIFGPAKWLRGLIQPSPGMALAYLDWCNQEYGIAAVLSGDASMISAYMSGDPYIAFGHQSGQLPRTATATSHPSEREINKDCVLGVMYGMGPQTLACRIGRPLATAKLLLTLHRETYRRFWEWAEEVLAESQLFRKLQTVFGWTVNADKNNNPRSLCNFPCQANAAEMLRWACFLATERGVAVCMPVHDALLIEAPSHAIEETIAVAQGAMNEASEAVLAGFRLRTEVKSIVHWPDRYIDERGREMWSRATRQLHELADGESAPDPV